MEMLFYLALGAVLYGIVAERSDRAVDREMRKRQKPLAGPQLVQNTDDGPAVHPRNDWVLRGLHRLRARVRPTRSAR